MLIHAKHDADIGISVTHLRLDRDPGLKIAQRRLGLLQLIFDHAAIDKGCSTILIRHRSRERGTAARQTTGQILIAAGGKKTPMGLA